MNKRKIAITLAQKCILGLVCASLLFVCPVADSEAEDKNAALMEAAKEGKLKEVEVLLETGAHVKATDKDGWTPLMWASWGCHPELVKLLVNNGADLNARDKKGQTALSSTAGSYLVGITPRGSKMDPNAPVAPIFKPLKRKRCLEVIKLLLDRGADVNVRDNLGDTVLARMMLSSRVSVWPLTGDAMTQFRELLRLLLEKGADVNATALDATPLMLAMYFRDGALEMVKLLLGKGADVKAKNEHAVTALMIAASQGRADSMRLILDKGANVNARDKDGKTALIWACDGGTFRAAKILLERGADVNAEDKFGNTALAYAGKREQHVLRYGRPETGRDLIHLLLKHGAKE